MLASAALCSLLLCLLFINISAAAPLTPSTNVSFRLPSSYGDWSVALRPWKGTIAAIQPNTSDPFSFINDDTPGNYSSMPYYHSHGDVTLRVRTAGTGKWQKYTTADVHSAPAQSVDTVEGELAAFDVSSLMRPGHGLRVVKRYAAAALNTSQPSTGLTLEVLLTNAGSATLELGGFGVSALFSSNWNDMDLDQAAAACSLAEPYIGGQHGYVKVTRLTGEGRVLLMAPAEGQRGTSGLTAWRQLKGEDATPTGYAFEGHYEWTSLAGAWQQEWKQSQPWVKPDQSTIRLEPNATVSFRYTYQLVDGVRGVDDALVQQGNASIRAVPGYILSTEMRNAKLYVHPPAHASAVTFDISGTGNLTLTAERPSSSSSSSPYRAYHIAPHTAGRVNLAVHFHATPNRSLPTTTAHVSLLVLPPFRAHLESLGRFTAQNQWVDGTSSDPFGRASSVMPYDFEARSIVWQDERSYVVGLSDEAGAGPGLQLMMSQRYAPTAGPLRLLDSYINQTLWGVKAPPDVPYATSVQNANYSVRASMFWYPNMTAYAYEVRNGWDQDRASQLWRSYNYVHPTVLYHSMYRVARDYDGLQRLYGWEWYLNQAVQTFFAMFDNAPYYTQFGLMEGSVFLDLMNDLQLEGWTDEYKRMFTTQQQRVGVWEQLSFPFGSEMPWDSTGQEEIWLSAQAFGSYSLSNASLSAILAYTHSIPVWAYHGSSRRFWDFWINGKPNYTQSWPERNLHHYGSSLNGKPLLRAYEINPDDYYLLEPGVGAMVGVLSNIQPGGAASMGFHADNGKLVHDPFDADYGCALYGHVTSASAYFVHHPTLGPSCYLCNFHYHAAAAPGADAADVTIEPLDSLHRRLYLEPLGTAIAVDVGRIRSALLSMANRTVVLTLEAAESEAEEAGAAAWFSQWRLSVDHYALCEARPACDIRITEPAVKEVRGAWTFPYTANTATVTLAWGGGEGEREAETTDGRISQRSTVDVQ